MIGLPWWLSSKESACKAGDAGSNPGLGTSPGQGNGKPVQYSSVGNHINRENLVSTVVPSIAEESDQI